MSKKLKLLSQECIDPPMNCEFYVAFLLMPGKDGGHKNKVLSSLFVDVDKIIMIFIRKSRKHLFLFSFFFVVYPSYILLSEKT